MTKKRELWAVVVAALGTFISLPGAAQATSPTVVSAWNAAALDEVRRLKLGPPIVARALAIAHTCMYDAWAAYDPRALPVVSQTPRRPAYEQNDVNKAKAISYAAYGCLQNLFPANAGRLSAVMTARGYNPADASTNLATPQGIGNAAAAAVLASRRNDGANQYGDLHAGAYSDYTGFVPSNGPMPFCLPDIPGPCAINVSDPYHWQPLINSLGVLQVYIGPQWERVTPFALTSADQFDSNPAAAAGPQYLQNPVLYQANINEIIGASAALDAQKKLIVEYWADGPNSELPPGHWGLFAQWVSQRDANSIDDDIKMFFAMHNASFDAGIMAWHLKRKYVGVRPITAVRYFRQGLPLLAWGGPYQGTQIIDGGKWTPYNPGSNLTPAFPGWVSGHASFSASSAAVLRAFTGNDAFGFATTILPGFGRVETTIPAVPTTLSYPTFTAAANEAAASRLLGGIHFSDDNNVGLVLGDLVGKQAWAKSQFLFEGGLTAGSGSRITSPGATTLDWQHTVPPGNNRLLLVGVASTNNNGALRVSYGGLPLTRLAVQADTTPDNRIEMWYMVAPRVGTTNINVQLVARADVVAGAANYGGVNQASPFGTVRGMGSRDGTAACVTLANEPARLVASFVAASGDAGSVTPGSGLTTQFYGLSDPVTPTGANIFASGAAGPSVPVGSVCQQLQFSRRWAMLAVPLKPAFD